MKPHKLFTLFAVFGYATAHTTFTTLYVDDISQGDGTCVRMPWTPATATFPIIDLGNDDMACGRNGMNGVSRVCPVTAQSKLGFLFRTYPNGETPGFLDPSHKGPCAVYVKPVVSAIQSTAVGNGWIKIWEEGHNEATNMWCTERLSQNGGLLSINLPKELAGGGYLARAEILSLHEADKNPPNPQFYIGCAQIFLKSAVSNKIDPQDTVRIPGFTNIHDPAVLFNIYEPKFPYKTPGPAVFPATKYVVGKNFNLMPTQKEGLLPGNAIVTNANWWGVEVAKYADELGCYRAADNCFAQLTVCYDTAPPTGSKGCKLWEYKCTTIQHNCASGKWIGPPHGNMAIGNLVAPAQKEKRSPAAEIVLEFLDKDPLSSSSGGRTVTHFEIVTAPVSTVTAWPLSTETTTMTSATDKAGNISVSPWTKLSASPEPTVRLKNGVVIAVQTTVSTPIVTASSNTSSIFENVTNSLTSTSGSQAPTNKVLSSSSFASSTLEVGMFFVTSPVTAATGSSPPAFKTDLLPSTYRGSQTKFPSSTATKSNNQMSAHSTSPKTSFLPSPTSFSTSIIFSEVIVTTTLSSSQSSNTTSKPPFDPTPSTTINYSKDGTCGLGKPNRICDINSSYGGCCGVSGMCGADWYACREQDCQPAYGVCGDMYIGIQGGQNDEVQIPRRRRHGR